MPMSLGCLGTAYTRPNLRLTLGLLLESRYLTAKYILVAFHC